jgi:mannosyltransferase OCH1-like enzyme
MNSIPKIIFQVSKFKQQQYVIDMIKSYIPGDWVYINYIDGDEVGFFLNNPLKEFPDIIKKFHSIKLGQHRADLFRYYVLYITGGVYIDSDAMIYTNIEKIIRNYNFVSVKSIVPDTIFNGFIASGKGHDIILKAIQYIYSLDNSNLEKKYLLICENLYNIITKNKYDNIKLYQEYTVYNGITCPTGTVNTMDDKNNILLTHYQLTKVIPNIKSQVTIIEPKVQLKSKLHFYLRK